jgi:hypothetical protein
MPVEFYQSCWEIIREDIMDMIHEFWKNELDIDKLYYGVITLIPKIKEASKNPAIETHLPPKCQLQNYNQSSHAKV